MKIFTKSFILILTLVFSMNIVKAQEVGIEIGNLAPEINLPGPDGRNIALSSLRGNIVLIDFWASWCVPCRQENPRIRRVYNRFQGREFVSAKGFTVYGVSLDRNQRQWTEAISKDKLEWPYHVSDLQGWRSAAANTYRVNAIPYNFVIDENGIIIAKGVHSKELEELLNTLTR